MTVDLTDLSTYLTYYFDRLCLLKFKSVNIICKVSRLGIHTALYVQKLRTNLKLTITFLGNVLFFLYFL